MIAEGQPAPEPMGIAEGAGQGGADSVPDGTPLSCLAPREQPSAPGLLAAPSVQSAAAAGACTAGHSSPEATAAEVMRLKAVLDLQSSSAAAVLHALEALRAMGSLPTKVLSDTLVGKTVNQLAKGSSEEAVRTSAKRLVEDWRQIHRKRKSSASLADAAPKRTNSVISDATTKDQLESEEGTKGVAPLEKMTSTVSLTSLADSTGVEAPKVDAQLEPHREKVRQKLIEALGKEEEIETKGGGESEDRQRDPAVLACEIEEALADAMPKKEAYLSQARSVLYNLKDSKNPTFRFKLMVGFYKPQDVPTLTAEDMASDEKNAERAAQRKYAMEEIQSDWALKHGQQRITGMFTCGKCKGIKTTYFQMQTRSSDEPMTTFVTCLTCNNRWKFC